MGVWFGEGVALGDAEVVGLDEGVALGDAEVVLAEVGREPVDWPPSQLISIKPPSASRTPATIPFTAT